MTNFLQIRLSFGRGLRWVPLLAAAALAAPAALAAEARVSFVRDVMPVLNKTGCTAGTCHGAAKGKNGFKLSLRGYDPEFDYRSIVHDLSGRRFNRTEPARSLVLLKPALQLAHGGGLRFETDSAYYKTILQWISEGTDFGDPVSAAVSKLDVQPPDILMEKPGLKQQLKVTAYFADGASRDVTREALYSSNTPTVAQINDTGFVASERKGEAAMLVRYEGSLAVTNVTVLADKPGFAFKPVPENNFIDKFINAKLERLKILPSGLTSDAEFLRRVSYDLVGLPPSAEELRAFLADRTPAKRARAIDRLMARPEYVDHWSVKWGDLLQVNRNRLGDKGMWAFREWIRESIAENKPYDRMVRELITARGSTFQNPPANFFRFTRDPKVAMETTTQLFLGVRMVCAQCHDHPFEKWTQNQYFQLTAFFGGVGIKEGADANEEIVFDKREEIEVKHPKDGRVMSPKFLFGAAGACDGAVGAGPERAPSGPAQARARSRAAATAAIPVKMPSGPSSDPAAAGDCHLREALADWLTSPANELFAKAMANRMWSYFFGRGIIDPVDDIRASNPPSNPRLLDALTQDFVAHNFDLRHLVRGIVNSATYQLSYQTNEWNADDEINFSHAQPRRLSAEQLFDGLYQATGSKPFFREVPSDFRAQQFPDSLVGLGGFLDLFGRPERQTSCECERRSDVSLVQALNLVNGSTIADAIADEKGLIARLILAGASDRQLVEEIYLAALSRPPEPRELDLAQTYLARGLNRGERAQDLLWALLNSNAFLFNR